MPKYTERVIASEVFLSRIIRLDGVRVRLGCKADRIELRRDGVLEVLDFKTSADGRVLHADGHVVMVWIDRASGKPIALPDAIRALTASPSAPSP